MKRYLLAITLLAFSVLLPAQQPWSYATVQEMHLDDAYLLPMPDSLQQLIAKRAKSELRTDCRYRLTVEDPKSSRPTVRFMSDSCDFSIRWQHAEPMLPYLVSDRYWRERLAQLRHWTYVAMDNTAGLLTDTTGFHTGRFSPISWIAYDYQPSPEGPVVFTVRTNRRGTQRLTLQQVRQLAESGAFTTDDGMTAYENNLREQRAIELARQRALQLQLDSLERVTQRQLRLTDSIAVALRRDSLQQAELTLRAQVQATKERMNREQIFLMSVKAAKSDYMFGLEFNFYNCFQKPVSRIEISVVPVNDRGQVQSDEFRRTVRTVRCMGPILPGTPAQYIFDELFWDQKGRIKYMRVNSVIFHFPDGTRRSFNGYQTVLKHTLNN